MSRRTFCGLTAGRIPPTLKAGRSQESGRDARLVGAPGSCRPTDGRDEHASHFSARGVDDIPSFLNSVLQETPVKTGMTKAGPFAEYVIDGKMYKVGYGTNDDFGFI